MAEAPKHEDVQVRAYELYLECGCEGGHELQHWLEAEAEITNALNAAEQQTAPSATQRASGAQQGAIASRTSSAQTPSEQQRTAVAGRERG
jgi:Protein of unknown function (DUF2934)